MIIHSNVYNSKVSVNKKPLNTVNVEAKVEVVKKSEVKKLPIIKEVEEIVKEEIENIISEDIDVLNEEK